MDYHIEITLLPDPEFQSTTLMGALYNKLHRGLVAMQTNRIAVSFPDYQYEGKSKKLGERIRLHGDKAHLEALMATNWLKGMNDHIEKTDILPVPDDHQHLKVSRVQCKSNVQRLRARRMKRHNETWEQAAKAIPDEVERRLELPYIVMKSGSTGQQFYLFITQSEASEANPDATFNCYGLSQQGTVPGF